MLPFPSTFLWGNLLNAADFLPLAEPALHTGKLRLAATELAILLLPLDLI